MADTTANTKELVTLRIPRVSTDEARAIAERENESLSMVLRRLIRRGIEVERRSPQGGDR